MRHQLSPKELMYLKAHRTARLCPWCVRKLSEVKYSRLLPSQIKVVGAVAEEAGACSECGQERNVFFSVCGLCGQAAPDAEHLLFGCSVRKAQDRELLQRMAAEMEAAAAAPLEDHDMYEDEDDELAPIKFVRGGLPTLGKRR